MRINSKFLLFLILLFLFYILLFSSTGEDDYINYKELMPEIRIKEFLQANYYIGKWSQNVQSGNRDQIKSKPKAVLKEYDGKIRFAVLTRALQDASLFFDDSKRPYHKLDNSSIKQSSDPGWQVFIQFFDSKYIDTHLYRISLKDGRIDGFNQSDVYMHLIQKTSVRHG